MGTAHCGYVSNKRKMNNLSENHESNASETEDCRGCIYLVVIYLPRSQKVATRCDSKIAGSERLLYDFITERLCYSLE